MNSPQILNFAQMIDKTSISEYVEIQFYQGRHSKLEDREFFHVIRAESNKECLDKLAHFNDLYGGVYTCLCKTSVNAGGAGRNMLYVEFRGYPEGVPPGADPATHTTHYARPPMQGVQPVLDVDELTKTISDKITADFVIRDKDREIQELKNEIADIQDSSKQIMDGVATGVDRFTPVLQYYIDKRWGNGSAPAPEQMQGFDNVDELDKNTKEALLLLTDLFEEEGIQILAESLQDDEPTVNFVKNYIDGKK